MAHIRGPSRGKSVTCIFPSCYIFSNLTTDAEDADPPAWNATEPKPVTEVMVHIQI